MANLFFVYTPFQLYVAQEIIIQENLQNNILLKGYVLGSPHFLDIYEYMKIKKCWDKEIFMERIGSWLDVDLYHPFNSVFRINKDYKYVQNILKQNSVTSIYFGDINNKSARLASRVFSAQGIMLNFYEEGASHYHIYNSGACLSHRPFMAKLYQYFFDLVLFIPTFRQRLGKYVFSRESSIDEINIQTRYSIIPQYHEAFDRQLFCKGYMGEKAITYIDNECSNIDVDNCILFLDQPIYEIVNGSLQCYLETLSDFFNTLPSQTFIVIKYHPRESFEVKGEIEKLVTRVGLKYTIISSKVNLPVELYMQRLKFKQVVNIFTSAAFYNGYLFNKIPYKYLLEEYYQKCMIKFPVTAHRLDGLIKFYNEQVK